MLTIHEALAPVLRDVASTTDLTLVVKEEDWTDLGPCAYAGSSGSGTTGIYFHGAATDHQAIAFVTDLVQDFVVEEIGGRASNWPICPGHRSSHPLQVALTDDDVWWTCPDNSSQVARVGELSL